MSPSHLNLHAGDIDAPKPLEFVGPGGFYYFATKQGAPGRNPVPGAQAGARCQAGPKSPHGPARGHDRCPVPRARSGARSHNLLWLYSSLLICVLCTLIFWNVISLQSHVFGFFYSLTCILLYLPFLLVFLYSYILTLWGVETASKLSETHLKR